MEIKKRIHLENLGQDLTYVDVGIDSSGIGEIIDVPSHCAYGDLYIDQAFDINDNTIGSNFNYAKPLEDFIVVETKFKVKRIENL